VRARARVQCGLVRPQLLLRVQWRNASRSPPVRRRAQ
jgi:hypothetical protein